METTPAQSEKKIGKFRASYLLATESFELFRKDKEIVWYVVLNALSVLAIITVFIAAGVALMMSEIVVLPAEGEPVSLALQIAGYAVLFVMYLACAYVTTYFGVALTSIVAARIEGEDKGFKDGLRAASGRSGQILSWSLLSSTVGIILQIIADKASWVGRLVSWLGGVAWNVATFFIVPVLARENLSVGNSVRRSGEIFVKTWGETIVMNFSLGLFFLGVHVSLLVAVFAVGYLLLQSGLMVLLGILVVLYLIAFIVIAVVQSVLEAIFKVVLYEYATRGTVPESFTPQLIVGALTKKVVATPVS